MTWRQLTAWDWVCDRCGVETVVGDDRQPGGWIHTMDGRDLCPDCAEG